MSERMDCLVGKPRGEKTYWIKIGSAWAAKSGDGYDVSLDVLPIPDDKGRCGFIIRTPKERKHTDKSTEALDDYVPF